MADLDDFFAKKDRKRGKAVKKFSTPEEIVKKIEDTKQKNDIKIRKDRQPGQGQEGEDGAAMPGDEDEWREYEVAKKDYTGLKIQPLTGQEQREGAGGGHEGEGPGGPQPGGPGRQGPWNKGNEPSEGGKEEAPAAPPAPAPAAAPAPATGGYIPPSLRNRPAQGPAPEGGLRPRGMKMHAPDIHSEEYFPTLGGGEKEKKAAAGGGAWSSSPHGGGGGGGPRAGPQPLALGNRYSSLTDDS